MGHGPIDRGDAAWPPSKSFSGCPDQLCFGFAGGASSIANSDLRLTCFFTRPPQLRNAAPAVHNVAAIQARTYAAEAKATPTEVSSILEQRIRGVQEEAGLAETGRVLSVGYVRAP